MKRLAINLLKFGVSAAILTYLAYTAQDAFAELRNKDKDWGLLLLASLLCLLSVLTTFVRWYFLVRALELPFRLRDAMRLGFLGYLFNFVSLGSVGGDLFKAVFIAREQPGRRVEAVATVLVDRVIGLYALFIVATVAILVTGLRNSPVAAIQTICDVVFICTGLGAVGILMVLTPGFTNGSVSEFLAGLPKVGPAIAGLLSAVRMYRRKKPTLILVGAMSVAVHSISTVAIFCIARGLPGNTPSLGDHFLIWPMGILASALPLPLSGLGATEAALEFLYLNIPTTGAVTKGAGLLVSLGYRAITIAIAIVGVCYYWANRALVSQLMKDSDRGEEPKSPTTPADNTDALPPAQVPAETN